MNKAAESGYIPIENYGIIGDMHTCALVSRNGSIDFMCWPVFDSPSIFCRLLDKNKGGHFSISVPPSTGSIDKQRYLPYTNLLETRWINEDGVLNLVDFFPVSKKKLPQSDRHLSGYCPCNELDRWETGDRHSSLIRKLECPRGFMDVEVELFPAFDYARDHHTVHASFDKYATENNVETVYFEGATERLQLDIFTSAVDGEQTLAPNPEFKLQERPGHLGRGLVAALKITEGQQVTFVLHSPEKTLPAANIGSYLFFLESETYNYWTEWCRKCTFRGHYREQVERSLLVLKLLTYKPTGAVIAAPTFSLPENIGGTRNWDYRYSWVRDTAFTLYVFLKNGYHEEAESYISFIFDRIFPPSLNLPQLQLQSSRPFLPIMFTIRGDYEIPESELSHFEGYRGSRPVRIGNAASFHTQLDIYGELLDSIYLYNKHAKPISYDQWVSIRRMVNYVIEVRKYPDMSIWEVRGKPQNFVYSKMMLWVALDRALRLAEKRSTLPCPDRHDWLRVRDELYDEIMDHGYNKEKGCFIQSYENPEVLDAALSIAPLVFFIEPNDKRFLSTLAQLLDAPEKGGLTSAKMVFRYDHSKAHDGIGGREGAFIMVTFWVIEAMIRASKYDSGLPGRPASFDLRKTAIAHFDNVLSFANHLGMFSEEVAVSGEQMGNVPQAFSHLACVSAAMNLNRDGGLI
ncbi:Six-hairpin glycosidase-like protein [Elaphomyces granulatus]